MRSPVTHRSRPEGAVAVRAREGIGQLLPYVVAGTLFGILLVKSEVVSWFRIQEMFRFQSFHMYGILGSATTTAAAALWILRRLGVRTRGGSEMQLPAKELGRGRRYPIGGMIFGLGWALTGTCPGPLFALVGGGGTVFLVVVASALGGTWMYGQLRPHLPH